MVLTHEQQAFAEAIREFCARECGTREQRDGLTENGVDLHNPGMYAKVVDAGRGTPPELARLASMAKVKVTETAKRIALEGMQMTGGYGYACEYDMERHVRLALAPTIYAGTNEIQREIIAGTLRLRG
jgi:alkylation response protein AidB-like acyl-CoA dehydrogenase